MQRIGLILVLVMWGVEARAGYLVSEVQKICEADEEHSLICKEVFGKAGPDQCGQAGINWRWMTFYKKIGDMDPDVLRKELDAICKAECVEDARAGKPLTLGQASPLVRDACIAGYMSVKGGGCDTPLTVAAYSAFLASTPCVDGRSIALGNQVRIHCNESETPIWDIPEMASLDTDRRIAEIKRVLTDCALPLQEEDAIYRSKWMLEYIASNRDELRLSEIRERRKKALADGDLKARQREGFVQFRSLIARAKVTMGLKGSDAFVVNAIGRTLEICVDVDEIAGLKVQVAKIKNGEVMVTGSLQDVLNDRIGALQARLDELKLLKAKFKKDYGRSYSHALCAQEDAYAEMMAYEWQPQEEEK